MEVCKITWQVSLLTLSASLQLPQSRKIST